MKNINCNKSKKEDQFETLGGKGCVLEIQVQRRVR